MSHAPMPNPAAGLRDPVARALAGGALAVSLVALVFTMSGVSSAGDRAERLAAAQAAAKKKRAPGLCRGKPPLRRLAALAAKPRPCGLLRLNRKRKFPASAIPKVAAARRADRLGGARRVDLALNCPEDTADLGTWCLQTTYFPVPIEDIGRNDFLYAAKHCVEAGGYLPSAAQLIGAADRIKLAGRVDDNAVTAGIDEDPFDGLKDAREMSGSLFTITAGSSAAGSQGVSEASTGDPKQSEPDPVPFPADPVPDTLQYVTVYDNGNRGGFAGGKPVGSAERFRCAFDKVQGEAAGELR